MDSGMIQGDGTVVFDIRLPAPQAVLNPSNLLLSFITRLCSYMGVKQATFLPSN